MFMTLLDKYLWGAFAKHHAEQWEPTNQAPTYEVIVS